MMKEVRGLPNIGKTCYINSVIQLLFNVPEFRHEILKLDVNNKDSFLFYFQLVFRWLNCNDNLDRNNFKTIMQVLKSYCNNDFIKIEEGDANQFLLFTLAKIDSEVKSEQKERMNEENEKMNLNLAVEQIIELFRGIQEYRTRCQNCNLVSEECQTFYTLTLNNKMTQNRMHMDKVIIKNLDEQHVPDVKCEFCLKNEFMMSFMVTRWPYYLIINLSKLKISTSGSLHKYNWCVNIPELKFSVPRHTKSESNSLSINASEASCSFDFVNVSRSDYEVIGVVNHTGSSKSGHYVAVMKTENWDWLMFNDGKVIATEERNIISKDNVLVLCRRLGFNCLRPEVIDIDC